MEKLVKPSALTLSIFAAPEKIRALCAPDLTDAEFEFFFGLAKGLQANPFIREIWAVKYDKAKPASIFLGRDFYRRKAEELPEYEGHLVDAVYSNDEFVIENGIPHHRYSVGDRGKLLGAYCVVYIKARRIPFYVFVDLGEYDKGFGLWKTMKATMIKKVAEAQGLRGAFQGVFSGTYDESEEWRSTTNEIPMRPTINLHDPHVNEIVADIRKSFEELIIINPSLYKPKSENFELALDTGEREGEPLTLALLEQTQLTLQRLVKHLRTVKEAASGGAPIETPVKYNDENLDQMLDLIMTCGVVKMTQEFKAARKRGDMEACARIYEEAEQNAPKEEQLL